MSGCDVRVAAPRTALPGNPWIWRTMFWDAFPNFDVAMLNRGFHVAYIDAGDTFAAPAALQIYNDFYAHVTTKYGFSERPALEGLSRGAFAGYRWAYFNPDKVGCVYGDAPLCDIYLLERGTPDQKTGIVPSWAWVLESYGHSVDDGPLVIEGNPIDGLARLAAANIPIIHVCGDIDTAAVNSENNDIVRERYLKLGGEFVLIMKEQCPHHPHGLSDPSMVADYIVAKCAGGDAAEQAKPRALKPGTVVTLPVGAW